MVANTGSDGAVPSHPFRTFADISRAFSEKHVESGLRRRLLLAALGLWRRAFGIDGHTVSIRGEIGRGGDGYRLEYLTFKSIFYPEVAASFIMAEDGETDPCRKAAQVIFGAMRYRERLARGEIAVEREANRPLDMDRYSFFFSRLTRSTLTGGRLVHKITDVPASDYVVIAVDGLLYRVQVLEQGVRLGYDRLLASVRALVADARQSLQGGGGDAVPLGLLTALCDKKTVRLFSAVADASADVVATLDSALFFVAIDLHSAPQTFEKTFRAIHSDHFHNRDHRRSLQIVVTGNGRSGVVVNPHAGLGGTLSARLASELYLTCRELAGGVEPRPTEAPAPERLRLVVPRGKRGDRTLSEMDRAIRLRLHGQVSPTAFRLDGVGKRDFVPRKLSADGAFHCAAHLAYFRQFGVKPIVGNFINLRNVKHGDIWRYNSTSPEMLDFVARPSAETLAAAIGKHRDLIKAQKRADDELYLGVLTLARLVNHRQLSSFAFISLMLILSCFVKRFVRSHLSPHLWLSHIPELEGVEVSGRAAVRLSYIDAGCLAGHYMIFDDHVNICLLRGLKDRREFAQEQEFALHLGEALRFVKELAGGGRTEAKA
jgi:hypothetical protein